MSHAVLAGLLAALGAFSVWGMFHLSADRAYSVILKEALARPGGLPEIVRVSSEAELAPELAEFVRTRPSGVHEWGGDGVERHLGVGAGSVGSRNVIIMEHGEIERDTQLAGVLALIAGLLAAGAVGAGYWVVRSTLAPLAILAERAAQPVPDGPGLAAGLPEDEVGFLARRLGGYVERHQQATRRELSFLADASHELRNPLTVLQGAVELLRESGSGDPVTFNKRLDRIERSIGRMQGSVEALLEMARQEEREDRAPQQGLREAVRSLVADHPLPEGVTIALNHRSDPPGSATLWLVVIRNLVENAVDHTGSGAISISLEADRVVVEDPGAGIAPDLLKEVTDSWVRGGTGQGWGLGLSIVHRLAQRVGWALDIESRLGEGTRVTLAPRAAPRVSSRAGPTRR